MRDLIAQSYILFEGKMYAPGEKLPVHNQKMTEAWIEAKTAAWVEDKSESVKAVPKTAEPGITGEASVSETEDGNNIAGKVPKTAVREKK